MVLTNGGLREPPRTFPENRFLLMFAILETCSQMLFSPHHARNDFREEITCEEAPA